MIQILSIVFGEEPPLYSRASHQQPPQSRYPSKTPYPHTGEAAPMAVEKQMKEHSRTFGNTQVTVKQGSIATDQVPSQQSTVKVNVLSPSQDLEKESIISKAFVAAGGRQLIQMYGIEKQQNTSGVVVTQGCGRINCDYVLHITLKKTPHDPRTVIVPLMQECFRLSCTYGCEYIAFPPLGVGRLYMYPAVKVAKCMFSEILRETQSGSSLKEISLIIYDKDEESYKVFKAALQRASPTDSLQDSSLDEDEVNDLFPYRPPSQVAPANPYPRRNLIVEQMLSRPKPAPRQLNTTGRITMGGRLNQEVLPFSSGRTPDQRGTRERPSSMQTHVTNTSSFDKRLAVSRDTNVDSEHLDSRSSRSARASNVATPRLSYQKKPKEISPDEPAVKYVLKVFGQDRTSCERARNELGKQLKCHFLYEKILERTGQISDGCKKKIRDTLKRWNVKSFLVPKSRNYVIKGEEKYVTEAYAETLKILLDEGKESEASSENKKARRRELQRKPDEFAKHMAFEHDPEIPAYWKNFKPGSPISAVFTMVKRVTKTFITVNLDTNDPVFKAIINLINATWESSKVGQGKDARGLESLNYNNIRVTKIHRVEHPQLFDKYLHRRKHVFQNMHKRQKSSCTPIRKLPGSSGSSQTEEFQRCHVLDDELFSEVNEHFFFHGTTTDAVDVICDNGLDSRLGSHQAMYGAGIYGAESPTKADQYADPKDKRTNNGKKMFLIRMVLGDSYLCTDQNPHKYRRPPCANTQCLRDDCKDKSHGSFDSVIGQSGRLFREFVVYQAEQCYPEYIISYDRV